MKGKPATESALSRERAEEATRPNEEVRHQSAFLQTLIDAIPNPVFYKDAKEFRYLGCNRAYEEFLGVSRDQILDKTVFEIWPQDLADMYHRSDVEVLAALKPQSYETTMQAIDGTRYDVLIHKAVFRKGQGEVEGLVGVVEDITERKRVEENLRQSEANAKHLALENAIMAEIGRIMGSTLNIEEVYESFSEEVKKIIPFERIVINTIDAEKGTMRNVYIAGEGLHDRNVKDIYPLQGSVSAEMVSKKSTVLVQAEDFSGYKERFPILGSTFDAGFRSLMNVPLFSKGKVIGGLLLRSRQPFAYTDKDVRLAERIGSHIGGAVANARLYAERVEAEKERAAVEKQLRQSQKMEAIGQLAGGVAHDFNNLLTIITGNCDLLLTRLPSGDPHRQLLGDILDAGKRAASLTRQLLAFSRKQVLEPKVLDLNEVVSNIEKMLRRLIGEDIVLTTVLSPRIRPVRIDPGQIEQVVINLAVNARDAMPQGGRLTFETRDIQLEEEYCHLRPDLKPGRYTMLSITDTGLGMAPHVKARIFEPFFTTKRPGKGTGLGLATVFGIVKQSEGHIEVESEPGAGSCFKIYLPPFEAKRDSRSSEGGMGAARRGTETILMVEDEPDVRRIARLSLEAYGYKVIEASGGREAITIAENSNDAIDLVLTDVVMPEMGGRQLAQILRTRNPALKILFMTGYTDDSIIQLGMDDAKMAVVQKPFTLLELARKVREILDGSSSGTA